MWDLKKKAYLFPIHLVIFMVFVLYNQFIAKFKDFNVSNYNPKRFKKFEIYSNLN